MVIGVLLTLNERAWLVLNEDEGAGTIDVVRVPVVTVCIQILLSYNFV